MSYIRLDVSVEAMNMRKSAKLYALLYWLGKEGQND